MLNLQLKCVLKLGSLVARERGPYLTLFDDVATTFAVGKTRILYILKTYIYILNTLHRFADSFTWVAQTLNHFCRRDLMDVWTADMSSWSSTGSHSIKLIGLLCNHCISGRVCWPFPALHLLTLHQPHVQSLFSEEVEVLLFMDCR